MQRTENEMKGVRIFTSKFSGSKKDIEFENKKAMMNYHGQ